MHGILALKVGLFVIKQVTSGLAERHCPHGDRINCGGQVDANHSINSKVIFPLEFSIPLSQSDSVTAIFSEYDKRPTAEAVFPRSLPVMMRSVADLIHLDFITRDWNMHHYHSRYIC